MKQRETNKKNNQKLRKTVSNQANDATTKTSTANRKLSKAKVTLSFLIVLIIVAYIISGIINLIKNPSDTFIVKEGKITKEYSEVGYIIRDEVVVRGENYKNGMEQIIDEGSRVAKGESMFRYYSNGEENLKEKIKELDIKIGEAVESNNDDLLSTDAKLLDTQIAQSLKDINKLNSIQTIQETKKLVSEYVTKKAKIAGELSPSGSQLRKLIEERNGYENELSTGSEYITAPLSGIVSYRVDGLEEVLTAGDFSKYNKEFLNNLNLKTGKIISTNNEQGKVINNFVCYVATTSKSEEAKNAKVGDKVKITVTGVRTVEAKIAYIMHESESETTLILEINEGIENLSLYRKVAFDIIWWDSYGYKVANSAIINEENLSYVIRTKAGYLEKVLVKLKKQGEDYSVVSNYSTSEIKELNISKNVKTSIMLYDELIISPTEEQIKQTE